MKLHFTLTEEEAKRWTDSATRHLKEGVISRRRAREAHREFMLFSDLSFWQIRSRADTLPISEALRT